MQIKGWFPFVQLIFVRKFYKPRLHKKTKANSPFPIISEITTCMYTIIQACPTNKKEAA